MSAIVVLFKLGAPRRGGGHGVEAFLLSHNSNSRIPPFIKSTSGTSTRLYENKLWDRLGIEEDEEPYWYLINCVATNELDLLRQCRAVTQDMKEDAIKFVVPLERKTRSHGPNKMVTEEKVKYPGYVFAKLRLCPHVYEAVQSLDYCRSWMGNVNHKGYKKLPPVPIALNELEVENFGLEEIEELSEEKDALLAEGEDAEGIIVDSEEEYENDPMYRGIDKEALQQFQGLKVADMVKVTTKGKFYNEDGIVRRLKDGRIFVRFYTYGTLFEEWLNPGDVRKLTADEVSKGLGGPSQPITQQDLDGPNISSFGGTDRPRPLRQNLPGTTRGGIGGVQRNRRQDRIANGYDRGGNTLEEQRREERNWNWHKQQTQNQQQETITDQDWQLRPGSGDSRRNSGDDWAQSDVDSQWGRKPPQRPMRRENRRPQQHQKDNRQTTAAIDGAGDWSAFVTSSPKGTRGPSVPSSEGTETSDFFSSLMTDLNKDLSSSNGGQQPAGPKSTTSYKDNQSAEDDFFASLMTELVVDDGPSSSRYYSNSDSTPIKDNKRSKPMSLVAETGQDDDFFASLEAELGTALDGSETSGSSSGQNSIRGEAEDFFAQLETELSTSLAEETLPPSAPIESRTRNSSKTGQQKSKLESATASKSFNAEELGKKTIPDLKQLLRKQGLKVGGKKAELVDRLLSTK